MIIRKGKQNKMLSLPIVIKKLLSLKVKYPVNRRLSFKYLVS